MTVHKEPVKSPTDNGNLILKHFSSGVVNFTSISAKIGSIFSWSEEFKTQNTCKVLEKQEIYSFYVNVNVKHFPHLLLFASRLVCFRQASECPTPIYWGTEDSKEMQCPKIPKTPLKMKL